LQSQTYLAERPGVSQVHDLHLGDGTTETLSPLTW